MSQLCFLCSQTINGDEQFYQHHVNQCLDNVGATVDNERSSNSKEKGETSAVVLQVDQSDDDDDDDDDEEEDNGSDDWEVEIHSDADTARAPAVEMAEVDSASGRCCPCCQSAWSTLGIVEEEEKEEHAGYCFGEGEGEGEGGGWDDVATSGYYELGSGVGKTARGTSNIIPVLSSLLTRAHKEGRTQAAFLCVPTIDHIQTLLTDFGWSCGYKNAQMLFSSLRHLEGYKGLSNKKGVLAPIPTIKELQEIVELAWKNGFDADGAAHFKNKLVGSKKWIGTTEIYVAFMWLGMRVKIADFPKALTSGQKRSESSTHSNLVKWIREYFSAPSSSESTSPNSKKRPVSGVSGAAVNALDTLMESKGSPVRMSNKQPLYLQHEGHSRTVVGLASGADGDWLLIFDPSNSPKKPILQAASALSDSTPNKQRRLSASSLHPIDKATESFWSHQPRNDQKPHPESRGQVGLDTSKYSKLLEPYKLSLASLKKNQEYQILYVEEGPLLSQLEISKRKVVMSTLIR